VVGQKTWEKMQDIYEGIQQGVNVPEATPPTADAYPGTPLQLGSRGENVRRIQNWLNAVSAVYPDVPSVSADGIFGPLTQNAVQAFQSRFNLTADGIVGRITWNRLYTEWQNLVAEGQA
jgi:peptidoglycan hydrolase-like protein with peptidoglycan-binding domain